MKKKKYRPSIYLKAAELIGIRFACGCCAALDEVGVRLHELELFNNLYRGDKQLGNYWWPRSNSEVRIKALKRTARIASEYNTGKRK